MLKMGKLDFIKDADDIKSSVEFRIHKGLTDRLVESETRFAVAEEEMQELTQNIEGLRRDLGGERQRSEKLIEQLILLRSEIETKEARTTQVEERAAQLENKISALTESQKSDLAKHEALVVRYRNIHASYASIHAEWVELQNVIKLATGKSTDAKGLKFWFIQLKAHFNEQETTKRKYQQALAEAQNKVNSSNQDYEKKNQQLQNQLGKLQANYGSLVVEKEIYEQKTAILIEQKEHEVAQLKDLLQNLRTENKALQESNVSIVSEMTAIMNSHKKENQEQQLILKNNDRALEAARIEMQALQHRYEVRQRELQEHTLKTQDLKGTILNLQEQVKRHGFEMAVTLQKLEQIKDQHAAEIRSDKKHIAELTASVKKSEDEAIKLTHLNEQKNTAYEAVRIEVQRLREDCEAYANRNLQLEELRHADSERATAELNRLRLKASQLEEAHLELSEQLLTKSRSLRETTDLYSKLQEEQKAGATEFNELNEQRLARERQLSHYADSLNKMKQDLRDQLGRFDYELQMARSVNPINDYLKITEREIRRVELQLKKTPAISKDRLRLEECIEELFEQRDFLTMNARRSTNEIDERRARLSKILGTDALQASPPPPPRAAAPR